MVMERKEREKKNTENHYHLMQENVQGILFSCCQFLQKLPSSEHAMNSKYVLHFQEERRGLSSIKYFITILITYLNPFIYEFVYLMKKSD